jgi:hypothetical protein
MSYRQKIEDLSQEIGNLEQRRDQRDSALVTPADWEPLDEKIQVLTRQRDALRASVEVLEAVDGEIADATTAVTTASERLNSFRRTSCWLTGLFILLNLAILLPELLGAPYAWLGPLSGFLIGMTVTGVISERRDHRILVNALRDAETAYTGALTDLEHMLYDIEQGRSASR